MPTIDCKIKPYIQPFERKLALRELETLSLDGLNQMSFDLESTVYRLQSQLNAPALAKKLTYWESVSSKKHYLTSQVLREATTHVAKICGSNRDLINKLPFSSEVQLPNRRCLRYGPHGIHEYRGKFFPQLVKSLLNLSGVSSGGLVVDPMCGSGTTLVEALLSGQRAYGFDMNPLSVEITTAKCELINIHPDLLHKEVEEISEQLKEKKTHRPSKNNYLESLSADDIAYVTKWFAAPVLDSLEILVHEIAKQNDRRIKRFFTVVLSNILRDISWQKNDDLRVRKISLGEQEAEIDVVSRFLAELNKTTRTVLAFLYQEESQSYPKFDVSVSDARYANQTWPRLKSSVDTIVTSPPYATALPYLDTDRLSLCYLRLLNRDMHRKTDWKMIGNREISVKQKKGLWNNYKSGKHALPNSITKLVDEIYERNLNSDAGFRRRNLPSLLVKYFDDMTKVLKSSKFLLKPGSKAYFVVGSNHTIAGGQRIDIETANLLAEIGESVGLKVQEIMPMEMLMSRDIFRKNASANEHIICFEN